jgi:hypothetical protein
MHKAERVAGAVCIPCILSQSPLSLRHSVTATSTVGATWLLASPGHSTSGCHFPCFLYSSSLSFGSILSPVPQTSSCESAIPCGLQLLSISPI